MAKKFNTLLVLGATVGAAAIGAYYYFKKQDEAFFDEDDDDTDFDCFEDDEEVGRNYVQLNPSMEKSVDPVPEALDEEDPVEDEPVADVKKDAEEPPKAVEEFFDEEDEDDSEPQTGSLEEDE